MELGLGKSPFAFGKTKAQIKEATGAGIPIVEVRNWSMEKNRFYNEFSVRERHILSTALEDYRAKFVADEKQATSAKERIRIQRQTEVQLSTIDKLLFDLAVANQNELRNRAR